MAKRTRPPLTSAERDEIARRVRAGEKGSDLAREFGVTRAYVSLLKVSSKNRQNLAEAELGKLQELLSGSTPEKEGLVPVADRWTPEHCRQLIWKLFRKRPGPRTLREYLTPYLSGSGAIDFDKPQPPKPRHINQIPPELAEKPDYVAYYLSPVAEKIAWREYELALAAWEKRHPEAARSDREKREKDQAPSSSLPLAAEVHRHANLTTQGAKAGKSTIDPGERLPPNDGRRP